LDEEYIARMEEVLGLYEKPLMNIKLEQANKRRYYIAYEKT